MKLVKKLELGKWYYCCNIGLIGRYLELFLWTEEQIQDGAIDSYAFQTYDCYKKKDDHPEIENMANWAPCKEHIDTMVENDLFWEVEDKDSFEVLTLKLKKDSEMKVWKYKDIYEKADGTLIIAEIEEV
jgi:hypothetical protein